jgi:hypothetical protein
MAENPSLKKRGTYMIFFLMGYKLKESNPSEKRLVTL